MKVTNVTVWAGRTFNHPYENYSNFKPSISISADIAADGDYEKALEQLQTEAEQMMERHKERMLSDLERLRKIEFNTSRAERLHETIKQAEKELAVLKKDDVDALPAPEEEDDPGDDVPY
jgi:hypothetical protein